MRILFFHNHKWFWLKNVCFSLNIQNSRNDPSLFSLRNIKILPNMQNNFFEILVQTALIMGEV